jgi:tetratricopeptide (TPR) repeat protein
MSTKEFLDAVASDHPDRTEECAKRLEDGLSQIESADDVSPYSGWVVHVFGEHLGQWERGADLLTRMQSLPQVQGSDAATGALRRGLAALRFAGGDASAVNDLDAPDLAQVMCAVCTTHVARHETDAAIAALRRALDAAAPGLPDKHAAIRSLAVAGNNLSAELEEKPELTDVERDAMLLAAQTGLTYWKSAGTWLQEKRAESQLARCLLRAGQADAAREHIVRSLAICDANSAPAFERFFAEALLARIEQRSGDAAAFEDAKARALEHYVAIPVDEQKWCRDALAALGIPADQ